MKYLGVVGWSVLLNRSPTMQHATFTTRGIVARYLCFVAESMQDAMTLTQERGGSGLNLTDPYKESATEIVDQLSVDATALRATNTIRFAEVSFISAGFDTDIDDISATLRPIS
ncbi:MAG: hypothetical protein K1X79_10710 [Oligoflexia bacterium]|nr:hypothetical protein [Oligoflexia bacterium]